MLMKKTKMVVVILRIFSVNMPLYALCRFTKFYHDYNHFVDVIPQLDTEMVEKDCFTN